MNNFNVSRKSFLFKYIFYYKAFIIYYGQNSSALAFKTGQVYFVSVCVLYS